MGQTRATATRWVEAEEDIEEDVQAEYKISNKTLHPMKVRVHIGGRPLQMEIDTGTAVSLISETVWKKEFPQVRPVQTNVVLQTYTGEPIPMVGKLNVHVSYGYQSDLFPLYVVKGEGPSWLGREWLVKEIEIRLEDDRNGCTSSQCCRFPSLDLFRGI